MDTTIKITLVVILPLVVVCSIIGIVLLRKHLIGKKQMRNADALQNQLKIANDTIYATEKAAQHDGGRLYSVPDNRKYLEVI